MQVGAGVDRLFILDMQPGRAAILEFTFDGTFQRRVLLRDAMIVSRFARVNNGFVAAVREWTSDRSEPVLYSDDGERVATIVDYDLPPHTCINPSGGAGFAARPAQPGRATCQSSVWQH